jgi:hypothetical protein
MAAVRKGENLHGPRGLLGGKQYWIGWTGGQATPLAHEVSAPTGAWESFPSA